MDYIASEMLIDSALIGAVVSIAMQGLKLLPEQWVLYVLTSDKEKQKDRMQAAIFVATFIAVVARSAEMGLIQWGSLYQVAGALAMALTTSYSVYKSVLKGLADKFPDRFSV